MSNFQDITESMKNRFANSALGKQLTDVTIFDPDSKPNSSLAKLSETSSIKSEGIDAEQSVTSAKGDTVNKGDTTDNPEIGRAHV